MATTKPCRRRLSSTACPYVLAHRRTFGRGWASAEAAHSFNDAAKALPLRAWRAVERRFQDGHTECWWAAGLTLLGYGSGRPVRAVCATTDRRVLPALSTWYLTTNLPAPLKEIVRLYGLRNWVEQSYKQVLDELGWANFMVRRDRAIRRHWTQVFCAFTFCGWHDALQARSSQSSAPPEVRKKTSSEKSSSTRTPACWPRLLRAVRAWLPRATSWRATGALTPVRPCQLS